MVTVAATPFERKDACALGQIAKRLEGAKESEKAAKRGYRGKHLMRCSMTLCVAFLLLHFPATRRSFWELLQFSDVQACRCRGSCCPGEEQRQRGYLCCSGVGECFLLLRCSVSVQHTKETAELTRSRSCRKDRPGLDALLAMKKLIRRQSLCLLPEKLGVVSIGSTQSGLKHQC